MGGAFVGLDKVIENRRSSKSLGIGADIRNQNERDKGEHILQFVEPDDLVKFGLIPEFIGRMPVTAVLDPLSEEALIDILIKPKNALTKQYAKLMGYEKVDLKFTDSALRAIAKQALIRKTGARGLRGVIETAMLDVMFEIPSKTNVKECIIEEECITQKKRPTLIYRTDDEMRAMEAEEKKKNAKPGPGSAESA